MLLLFCFLFFSFLFFGFFLLFRFFLFLFVTCMEEAMVYSESNWGFDSCLALVYFKSLKVFGSVLLFSEDPNYNINFEEILGKRFFKGFKYSVFYYCKSFDFEIISYDNDFFVVFFVLKSLVHGGYLFKILSKEMMFKDSYEACLFVFGYSLYYFGVCSLSFEFSKSDSFSAEYTFEHGPSFAGEIVEDEPFEEVNMGGFLGMTHSYWSLVQEFLRISGLMCDIFNDKDPYYYGDLNKVEYYKDSSSFISKEFCMEKFSFLKEGPLDFPTLIVSSSKSSYWFYF